MNQKSTPKESPLKQKTKEKQISPQQNEQYAVSYARNAQIQNKLQAERKSELLASFDQGRQISKPINNVEQFEQCVNDHKRIQNKQKRNLADSESNLFYNPLPNPIDYIDKRGDDTLHLGKMMMDNRQLKNRSLSISDQKDDLLLFYKYKYGFNKSGNISLERASYQQQLQQLQIRQQQKKVIGDMYQKNHNSPNSHITYKYSNIQNNPKYLIKLNPSPPQQPKKKKIVIKRTSQASPNKRKLTTEQSKEVLVLKQDKIPTQFYNYRQHQLSQLDSSFGSGQSHKVISIIEETQTSRAKKANILKESLNFQMQTEPNQVSITELENIQFQQQRDYYNPEPYQTLDEQLMHKAVSDRTLPNLNGQQNNKSTPFLSNNKIENDKNQINIFSSTLNFDEKQSDQPNIGKLSQTLNASSNTLQGVDRLNNNEYREMKQSPSKQSKIIMHQESKLLHQESNMSSNSNSPLKRGLSIQEKSAVQSKTSLVNLDLLEKDLIEIQKEYHSNSPLKRTYSYEQSPMKSIQSESKSQIQGGTQKWLRKPSQYTIANQDCGYSPEKSREYDKNQQLSYRSLQDSSISPQTSPKKQRSILSQRQSIERVILSKANQPYLEDKYMPHSQSKVSFLQEHITEEDQFQSSIKDQKMLSADIHNNSLNSSNVNRNHSLMRQSHHQNTQLSQQEQQQSKNQSYSNSFIKPFKLSPSRQQIELELHLDSTSKKQNTIQQSVLQEGYGVSLTTQFKNLQNQKVDVRSKDADTSEEEIEEEEFSDFENQSILEKYKLKGLLKDRHFIKYHKEIIHMLESYEKDGITKKQSQELLNLIYRAKKYEKFSSLMNGCEEFQTDLNTLDQDIKEQTENIEQRKDNLVQLLEVLNDIQDIDPNQEQEQLKLRIRDLKKVKADTIQNTKEYINEMNQLKSQEKVYQLSGLDKRKFLKSNLDKLKKQRQKYNLEQFKKICKTENLVI